MKKGIIFLGLLVCFAVILLINNGATETSSGTETIIQNFSPPVPVETKSSNEHALKSLREPVKSEEQKWVLTNKITFDGIIVRVVKKGDMPKVFITQKLIKKYGQDWSVHKAIFVDDNYNVKKELIARMFEGYEPIEGYLGIVKGGSTLHYDVAEEIKLLDTDGNEIYSEKLSESGIKSIREAFERFETPTAQKRLWVIAGKRKIENAKKMCGEKRERIWRQILGDEKSEIGVNKPGGIQCWQKGQITIVLIIVEREEHLFVFKKDGLVKHIKLPNLFYGLVFNEKYILMSLLRDIYCIKTETGEQIWKHSTFYDSPSLAISPDGQYFAIAEEVWGKKYGENMCYHWYILNSRAKIVWEEKIQVTQSIELRPLIRYTTNDQIEIVLHDGIYIYEKH